MIYDRDIWRAAQLLVKRYGADAAIEAARRADELLEAGDIDGQVVWKGIIKAVEQLQATTPPAGSKPN